MHSKRGQKNAPDAAHGGSDDEGGTDEQETEAQLYAGDKGRLGVVMAARNGRLWETAFQAHDADGGERKVRGMCGCEACCGRAQGWGWVQIGTEYGQRGDRI